MDFKVTSPEDYDYRSCRYSRPVEIGNFSINSEGKYCNDKNGIRYLSMPTNSNVHMDLNDGFSDLIDIHKDTQDSFDVILRWILSHEELIAEHFPDRQKKPKIDFVIPNGLLKTIALSICSRNKFYFFASKFKSVIYICHVRIPEKVQTKQYKKTGAFEGFGEEISDKEAYRRMTSWGLKFEQYLTSVTKKSRPNTSAPVNRNEKYYIVTKAKLDNYRLLMKCEIDAVDPDYIGHDTTSTSRYVEFKTSRIPTTEKQEQNFHRFKLLNWYLQCYFTGISRLVCGLRDDSGIVRHVQDHKVEDMPDRALVWRSSCSWQNTEKPQVQWRVNSLINFCSHFLDFIKGCDLKDDPNVYYFIFWKDASTITLEEVKEEEGEPFNPLIPSWYSNHVKVI